MKLSEAIRLGSMLHPQAFETLIEESDITVQMMGQDIKIGSVTSTCALGAALDGIGRLPSYESYLLAADEEIEVKYKDSFPICSESCSCPVEGCDDLTGDDVENIVIHLNDDHRWTRERIAEFVRDVEIEQAQLLVREKVYASK